MAFGNGDVNDPVQMRGALLVADGLRCARIIAAFVEAMGKAGRRA